jgi:hypothetical protein
MLQGNVQTPEVATKMISLISLDLALSEAQPEEPHLKVEVEVLKPTIPVPKREFVYDQT